MATLCKVLPVTRTAPRYCTSLGALTFLKRTYDSPAPKFLIVRHAAAPDLTYPWPWTPRTWTRILPTFV